MSMSRTGNRNCCAKRIDERITTVLYGLNEHEQVLLKIDLDMSTLATPEILSVVLPQFLIIRSIFTAHRRLVATILRKLLHQSRLRNCGTG
jgi:hypothetical protein